MGNIYTMAKFVYTWLGNETLETARAMDSIAAAAKISPILLDREYLTGYPLTWLEKATLNLRYLPPFFAFTVYIASWKARVLRQHYHSDDLEKLFSRPWFVRSWTFQESILASDAILLCGSKSLRWDVFVRGFVWFRTKHFPLPAAYWAFEKVLWIWIGIKRPRRVLLDTNAPTCRPRGRTMRA